MNETPFFYEQINALSSAISPNAVHVKNTALFKYFQRYILQKVISRFDWIMPDSWDGDFFKYTLYGNGYVAVINTDRFGVIPQNCTISGYNVFYAPNNVLVQNPLLDKTYDLRINRDCTLIKLLPDYGSIMDKINYYADLMAMCSESISTNLFNSRLAYIFMSESNASAQSFKKMMDEITAGKPAVFADKRLFNAGGDPNWQLLNRDLKSSYLVSDILLDLSKIENMMLTDFGFPNANTEKRERLNTDEVNANNESTNALASLMFRELQDGVKRTVEMFDINLSVLWADLGGGSDGGGG